MSTDDQRAARRDERERATIAALALIAPSPEMIREVLALQDARLTDTETRPRYAVIDIVTEQEPVTADR